MILQREQAANLSTHTPEPSRRFNFIFYDDDDAEESTIPLNEIISQLSLSITITPGLPTMEPKDSLIIGDEDLRTIPEKESNKFIESSVEDLVPIPKESKDTSDSDNECDLPFCDDSLIFPNPLFDVNEDFTTSNDESRPEEDAHEENFKIYSNYLFEFYDKYISRGDIDEIDAFLDIDVSTNIEDGYHDSEGDMIYLESLVINDTIPNLPPDVFLDHDPRSLMDQPDNDDLK
nr:hypothetical protein [Tanacetum cinerariifolium]